MSFGGDGIPGIERGVEILFLEGNNLPFIPRRFRVGGRFKVEDRPTASAIPFHSCVLCGGIISQGDAWNYEHPFPRWVHRLAGDVGERTSSAITIEGPTPTWRQLELAAHRSCNSLFADCIENPARNAIRSMVDGGTVSGDQIDNVLDWLDKVRTSAAHMATAFTGHGLVLDYKEFHFPNRRIGLFDRTAFFFRIDKYEEALDLWDCMDRGFLSTPGALIVRIKDLVILTVSNNYLLSPAFGLSKGANVEGTPTLVDGDGVWAYGFGSRRTRLETALIVAQPMRRQHLKEGFQTASPALKANGDGHVYHLDKNRWRRTRSLDFSRLPRLHSNLGFALAGLEAVEWLLLQKEEDHERMGRPPVSIAIETVPELRDTKAILIEQVTQNRFGIRPQADDRA